MRGHSMVTLLAAICLVYCGCPSVEGTLDFFSEILNRVIPPLTRPEKCSTGMDGVDKEMLNLTTVGLSPVDSLNPVPHSHGSSPDNPRPWLVRIGDSAAGVLISGRHVVTLAQCVNDFMAWYGGFFAFTITLLNTEVGVPRVDTKSVEENPYAIAVLTLSRHNLEMADPMCVGDYKEGLTAAVVSWNMAEGRPIKYPTTVYPRSECKSPEDGFRDDLMLCSSRQPMVCGSPLLQEQSGQWLLVGLSYGAVGESATYVSLGPYREKLGL